MKLSSAQALQLSSNQQAGRARPLVIETKSSKNVELQG
jgi:hypothetical protein